ncbi:MAG: GYD domain-containing protein [Planctomycetota bacterium]|nr:GYD domain-containing protein [Planctomycetota bacterium]MDP6503918.1 GYD domain-containing protein [Planctomycetota bacterium]
MTTYIALIQFTEQGLKTIDKSPSRAESFRNIVDEKGGRVLDIYWTVGPYDGVAIFSAPDEDTATALMVYLSQQGNVRTTTMRAYETAGFEAVLEKV